MPNKKNIEIIKHFNLSPHPEGGWFREIVRSKNALIRDDGQIRNFITGIYYLFQKVVFNTYLKSPSKQIKLNHCQENLYK